MIILLLIILLGIIFLVLLSNKDNYQLIDVAHDVCKIECINRGYNEAKCKTINNKFMDDCTAYMINLSGPIPSNLHLEDIYTEARASSRKV